MFYIGIEESELVRRMQDIYILSASALCGDLTGKDLEYGLSAIIQVISSLYMSYTSEETKHALREGGASNDSLRRIGELQETVAKFYEFAIKDDG